MWYSYPGIKDHFNINELFKRERYFVLAQSIGLMKN
jgi:hypothetical protein